MCSYPSGGRRRVAAYFAHRGRGLLHLHASSPRLKDPEPNMAWNIADLTEHVVDRVPDRIALIVAGEPRTYAQLEERANRLAHHLAAQGIGPGDHVGIYGMNSHAFVETIFA